MKTRNVVIIVIIIGVFVLCIISIVILLGLSLIRNNAKNSLNTSSSSNSSVMSSSMSSSSNISSAMSDSSYSSYNNKDNGVSFDYPTNWIQKSSTEPSILTQYLSPNSEAAVIFSKETADTTGYTLDQYVQTNEDQIKKGAQDYNRIDLTDMKVAGFSAKKIQYTNTIKTNNQNATTTQVYVNKNGQYYILTLQSLTSLKDKYSNTFDHIISSLSM